jgi:DNA (cytosine-5)-methyltransferase 1
MHRIGVVVTLVLSLFPGIGLLDMAFEEAGFCVVRGPDLLWGGDVRRFHPPAGRFDGVIGGPPCQAFSVMRYINPLAGQKHGNLIPEFERVVTEAAPSWFIMENVRDAPLPTVDGYKVHAQLLKDVWVGGETMRLRRISFGTAEGFRLPIETLALHMQNPEVSALAGGGGRTVPVALQRDGQGGHKPKKRYGNSGARTALGRGGSVELRFTEQLKLQGLPSDFLSEAPFTASAKCKAIGNGVPLPMGRAVAKAVARAMGFTPSLDAAE